MDNLHSYTLEENVKINNILHVPLKVHAFY
jgi:hypothetical protein